MVVKTVSSGRKGELAGSRDTEAKAQVGTGICGKGPLRVTSSSSLPNVVHTGSECQGCLETHSDPSLPRGPFPGTSPVSANLRSTVSWGKGQVLQLRPVGEAWSSAISFSSLLITPSVTVKLLSPQADWQKPVLRRAFGMMVKCHLSEC